ncbi:PadR family transcriptional regulator [Hamadaea tsunoensis]|uniref:PadR family transcriptional regulator n=1 Tax=Hamadaea tsunoensis TaxID=53368 RepID=UPI0004251A6D|nr:PadR family transcriptional regulator [Hamadaea tsunoensis]
MPIQHAVLALLRTGPSHGYELKGAFEAAIGPQWGALNIGHLYQVLDRLSRDGLVQSSRVAQDVKPDRVVYAMTPAGAAELTAWMSSPSPRTAGFRDDFFLKVMAAARSGDRELAGSVVDTQRTHLLQELRNLEQLRRDPDREPMVRLLLAAAARHVTADLSFLDDVETELPALVSEQARPAAREIRRAA